MIPFRGLPQTITVNTVPNLTLHLQKNMELDDEVLQGSEKYWWKLHGGGVSTKYICYCVDVHKW